MSLLVGSSLFFKVVCNPAYHFLGELDDSLEDEGNFVVVKHPGLFTSTTLSKAFHMRNVVMFNATPWKILQSMATVSQA
jgi:thiamine thiazole synthase